ncbi:Hypothetical predicted protein [Scomber scombrus]|uniref:Uncharacterized protein n=1 Tax=Scomber scombrus TaxID=13677 RepID=A0AAV1NZH6_SCOSC
MQSYGSRLSSLELSTSGVTYVHEEHKHLHVGKSMTQARRERDDDRMLLPEARSSKTAGVTCGRNVQEPTRERERLPPSIATASRLSGERGREDDSVNHRSTATSTRLAERERTAASATAAPRHCRRRSTATSPTEGSVYQRVLQLFKYPYLASAGMVSSLQAEQFCNNPLI